MVQSLDVRPIGERERAFSAMVPLLIVAVVAIFQLVAISLLYNHAFVFECRAVASPVFCGFLSSSVVRVICILGAISLLLMARPLLVSNLKEARRESLSMPWMGIQIIGFILILLPWFFVGDGVSTSTFAAGVFFWVAGAILAGLGTIFAAIELKGWQKLLSQAGLLLAGIAVVAGLAPEGAAIFQKIWKFDPLTEITFLAAKVFLESMGYAVVAHAPTKLLGVEDFEVLVGPQCSGVEGFLLIGGFLSFYMWLFKADLRFPRAWLLLPVGILLSWIFNVVRISTLIMTGHHVSPELAIGGFHSHAGWLMFTILAVGLAFIAHQLPALKKAKSSNHRAAPTVALGNEEALILPFIVFMASALLLSTFTELPALYYPIRFVAMVAVLLVFARFLRSMDWNTDLFTVIAGLAVGVAWLATAPSAAEGDEDLIAALAGLSGLSFVVWVVARAIGSTLLVPIIEELFFRGYILRRIDNGSVAARGIALAVSSGLFAALHDRWLLALIAGVAFGLLMLRRGKLTDAIWAHILANGVIVAWAIIMKDWSVI